jgi:hypothetical protein
MAGIDSYVVLVVNITNGSTASTATLKWVVCECIA